jgi:hypothetical protein
LKAFFLLLSSFVAAYAPTNVCRTCSQPSCLSRGYTKLTYVVGASVRNNDDQKGIGQQFVRIQQSTLM